MKENPLKKIVQLQKEGNAVGIYSACTANEFALRGCMAQAVQSNSILLIEATANQVDQYGGYTGMKPKDFITFVQKLAQEENLPSDRIILGGDHLGPLTFAHDNEDIAMAKSCELIRQYVSAGFTKIHIDTSMKVASDDPLTRLSDEIIASRGAKLAEVAENAYEQLLKENPDAIHPVYIVGSEVPIPGGSQDAVDNGVQVTKVSDFKQTVAAFKDAFIARGLENAWEQVIGVVVQPGVEEKDAGCTEYDRDKAKELMASIKDFPNLVFEGHSTDYQTKIKLREMVEDGVGILKVGPGLTYAAREGIFALAYAEKEMLKDALEKQSHFMEVLDQTMIEDPKYFSHHYHGTDAEIAMKRKFSFSDRSRYYMPQPAVEKALNTLLDNFSNGVPLGLLSQFMPIAYTKVREGSLNNDPISLIKDRVAHTASEYIYASQQEKIKL